MNIEKIKEMVLSLLDSDMSLYDVKVIKEYGQVVLQILVDKKDGITIDELARVNEKVSERMEEFDADMPEYLLEVSSPGAEKELRNNEEVKDAISKYINVKMIDGSIYEGYLMDANDDSLVVKINIKGRIKNVELKQAEIKKIRLAVKV